MQFSLALKKQRAAAFTLVEMMVAIGVFTLAGGLIFSFLNTGMVLYAKNTAMNSAHQQARTGVDQMLANIHASVSIPQLVDTNLAPIAAPGTGPAAGVDFQQFDGGPYLLYTGANVAATQNYIAILAPDLDANQSVAGLRFNIPSHKVEQDVASIVAYGSYRIIFFSNPVGVDIITKADGSGNGDGNKDGTSNIIGFTTHRVSYAVIAKELRYFPTNDPLTYRVIARNLIATTPFQILFNQNGGTDLRSVGAVNLTTSDSQYSNRGFAAVNMFINSYIPFRSRLTVFQ